MGIDTSGWGEIVPGTGTGIGPTFPATSNNKNTGASRQIGEFGGYPVGQVDVRTDMMKQLEAGVLPLLLQVMSDPKSIASLFGSLAGPVAGQQPSGLANFLFNDAGAFTGQPNGGQGGQGGGHVIDKPPVNAGGSGSQPAPVSNAPTTMPGYGMPALPNQYGGIGQVIPGWQGAVDPITGQPATGYSQTPAIQQPGEFSIPGIGRAMPMPGGGLFSLDQMTSIDPDVLKRLGIDFKAAGGPLDPNALTIVGEQGPEMIAGGNVIPLQGPGAGGFQASPMQGQGTGSIQRLLEQNPEMEAFNAGKNILLGQGGALNAGSGGQGVMNALQPVFQQNLKFGLNELTNRVPSVHNSGAAIEGADLTSRALNDFNLLASQAMMQGQQNTLGGLGMLGQLAGSAGSGAFGRNLQAGQLATQRDLGLGNLGLQAQQQQWNQTVNPTLQLLLAALGMATPTAFQTVVPGKK